MYQRKKYFFAKIPEKTHLYDGHDPIIIFFVLPNRVYQTYMSDTVYVELLSVRQTDMTDMAIKVLKNTFVTF